MYVCIGGFHRIKKKLNIHIMDYLLIENKSKPILSKKKYQIIKEQLDDRFSEDDTNMILDIICQTLVFNPNSTTYNPSHKVHMRQYREKLKKRNMS